MKTGEGLRSEAITAALDEAIRTPDRQPDRLYKLLAVASGLPGPRMNTGVAQGFANECAARGKAAAKVVERLATLDAELAPGATELEFLPVCGILAVGALAAKDPDPKARKKALARLHDASEDVRFRVREAAALALARIGSIDADATVREVASWMDGYFQAAAVLHALGDATWLTAIDDGPAVIERLDEAFVLAKDAPRSAVRWPGWKALHEELGRVPAAVATRFGVPVFDMLARWAEASMPELREAIESNLRDKKLGGRFHPEIERVRAALGASAPVPRDPTLARQGMRGRAKKRGRH
jgi:hypothetical protein